MKGFNNVVKIWKKKLTILQTILRNKFGVVEKPIQHQERKNIEKKSFEQLFKRKESLFLDLKGLESIWKRGHWTRQRMDLKEDKKNLNYHFLQLKEGKIYDLFLSSLETLFPTTLDHALFTCCILDMEKVIESRGKMCEIRGNPWKVTTSCTWITCTFLG